MWRRPYSSDASSCFANRNYNLDEKNPHVAEVENHDPEQLLAAYRTRHVFLRHAGRSELYAYGKKSTLSN